jgi:hypothetical protein
VWEVFGIDGRQFQNIWMENGGQGQAKQNFESGNGTGCVEIGMQLSTWRGAERDKYFGGNLACAGLPYCSTSTVLDGVRGGGGSASPSWFQICDTGSCGALGSVSSSWTG